MRAELRASPAEVFVRYHGPPDPGESFDAEQARAGRVVRRTVGEVCRRAASPPPWGRMLFQLVREFTPERCVELGTSLGISAAYTAAALQVNGRGELITLEGSDVLAELARKNLERLRLLPTVELRLGRHEETLPALVAEDSPIDFAFVDGRHEAAAVLETVDLLWCRLRSGAVLVFDDIAWSPDMRRAWREVAAEPRYAVTVGLGRVGVCVAA